MPLFEVELSDGTTSIMQAHSKRDLRAALANVTLTRVTEKKRCRGRNQENGTRCQEVATVQHTFCAACWENILAEFRAEFGDEPISEQELKDLAMSYFVVG